MTRVFRWIAEEPIPDTCDLRAAGWELRVEGAWREDPAAPLLLAKVGTLSIRDWLSLARAPREVRMRAVVCGVADSFDRLRLLRMEFGEALVEAVGIGELAARAARVAAARDQVPRQRQLGALSLDLVERQAWCRGRSLGLHPREFALLWRLSEEDGLPVGQDALLRDVWRLNFRPETNTVAVHISRLRGKLRLAGLDGLLETLPWGGYRLAGAAAGEPALRVAGAGNLPLDAHLRLREHGLNQDGEPADAGGIEA